MNGYLLSIVGTVLLSSLLTVIIPSGRTSAVIKGVAKLACVLIIVSPVLKFFQSGQFPDFSTGVLGEKFSQSVITTDESFIEYYSELRIIQAQEELEKELFDKDQAKAEISFLWEKEKEQVGKYYEREKIKITRIFVRFLEDYSQEKKSKIAQRLKEEYGSEVWIE